MDGEWVKRWRWLLGAYALAVMGVIGGCGFLLWVFLHMTCGNYPYQEIYSPDHAYKVVVFQMDCGATTGFSTQASILSASQDLANSSGNMFDIEGHPEVTQVKIEWRGNRRVAVTYPGDRTVYYRHNRVRVRFTIFSIEYHPSQ